jgi:TatA/E family protein of Tat protein translocase
MGGFSILHLILVLVIVLVFFGPSRLPSLGKSLGEAIRGFKKGLEGDEIDVTAQRRETLPPGQAPAAPAAVPNKDKTTGEV